MSREGCRRAAVALAMAGALSFTSAPAAAQVGIGPRFSFGHSTVGQETSDRYTGGLLRARLSPRTALELSLDYRTFLDERLVKVRDMPIQGSALLYLTRGSLAPYLLGGVGWYSRQLEVAAIEGETSWKFGYHAGLGGEIRMGRHAAVHLDYRYTLIHVGDDEDVETEAGAVPIPGLGALQDKLNLSHEGSMWTTGLTFYF